MYNCNVAKGPAPGNRFAIYFSGDDQAVLSIIRQCNDMGNVINMHGGSFGIIIDNINFPRFLNRLQQTPGMQDIAQRVRNLLVASTPKPSPFGSGRKPGSGSGGASGSPYYDLEPRGSSGIRLND